MSIFISCGETSGDKYAAAIVKSLHRLNPSIHVTANGGQYVESAGATLLCNVVAHSTIGFLEPIKKLPFFFSVMKKTKRYLKNTKPVAVLLIDHQGFNIPLAKWCEEQKIPVISLFSPQFWLWGKSEKASEFIQKCKKVFCVFEKEFEYYKQLGAKNIEFIGHPLLDLVGNSEPKLEDIKKKTETIVALFPGSRNQEINYLLPVMINVAAKIREQFPFVSFKCACASKEMTPKIEQLLQNSSVKIELVSDSKQLISDAWCSIVSSGTITLEHALIGTPCISIYKFNPISYFILKQLIWKKIQVYCHGFFSLPNIILEKMVIPELLQSDVTADNIVNEVNKLANKSSYQLMVNQMKDVRTALKADNNAIDQAANYIASLYQ